ncbi:MAG: ABC1 kinase family protein [cyanobacterium endosymbiont of Rhopalodia musculus]|uniref:ABC1 kinase family protein n=1 Tax=cyanobacterium endosymbiont of Epithemia clementina EcSB TaxID=3034674 RepID=UPI002480FAB2|nr:AarF/ABC1/UbiB kinase family protein [cyanobacterium endosymbiont of Epithemia clementina EcSB]WGT67485.1 AarF/ABC1/UbiB kinase family protein [cyanobacterium endosymbiont of Epithemia clementina EcSB]
MLTQRVLSKSPRWQRSKLSPMMRQWDIFGVIFKFFLGLGWDKLIRNNSSKRRHKRARWLVKNLLELGPTFIKIGQSLSTRVDIIPFEYIQELSQLQDRVPPFNSDEAINVIETELGKSIDKLFKDFESIPLASASLGQVHRAKLYTGQEVVVKVQRTGLEKIFNLDFEILHRLICLLNRYFSKFRQYQLEAIYKEFFELLFQEIDYIREGKNADRFRKNFKCYSQIKVPKVYWKYTTKRILVLEYLPGIKIDDRTTLKDNGINLDSIIQLGICSYLKQLLIDGFFQSDPHPGNMAVSQRGELIFYDFGTMAEVKLMAKAQMIQAFFAVLKRDTDKVVETLVYMGLIEPLKDMSSIKRIVGFILENFRDKPVDVKAFEVIGDEVYSMFKKQPFRLPPQMTFIIKSLTTLDGIARALDPQYNLLAASKPFVRSIVLSKGQGIIISATAKQAKDFIKKNWQNPNSTNRLMQRLVQKIDQGELQFRICSLENKRTLKLINLGIKCLIYACLTGFTLLSTFMLVITTYLKLAVIGFGLSGLFGLFFLGSIITLMNQEKINNSFDQKS